MEIEIVRHHRSAEDADGDVQHFAIAKDFKPRNKTDCGFAPDWLCEKNFIGKARCNGNDQRHHESLDQPKAAPLQRENDQHVERGDQYAGDQRKSEQQLERDGGAKNFSEVTSGDRNFANNP